MRVFVLITAIAVVSASSAFAHCGKPHPDGKDKQATSRPTPKPQ